MLLLYIFKKEFFSQNFTIEPFLLVDIKKKAINKHGTSPRLRAKKSRS